MTFVAVFDAITALKLVAMNDEKDAVIPSRVGGTSVWT